MSLDLNAADPASLDPPEFGKLTRVKIDVRLRALTLARVEDITPAMRRCHFQSPDLADFVSLSPDDHIKLFLEGPDGERVMRDYTPRRFDNASQSLVIDFALHDEAGPATTWARAAQPGDTLNIGGPRGSTIIPDIYDWYLLIGDETALPAMGRRVEELRPQARVTTIAAIGDAREIQTFASAAPWTAEWIRRDTAGPDDAANAIQALDRWTPDHGEGFIWVAGEAQFAKRLRAHLIDERHIAPNRIKAAGYWVRGGPGAHEPLG